ncbi:MAG: nucleotide pyrophosphohydrolase [Phycisphaerae bacterium]|nr:nucleotide pyrophosphohydrolase [Phycisphaerae bacterium]
MPDDSTTTVAELREQMARFVADRDWQQFHDPKNLTMSIAIEAAELMEHFQWLRSDQIAQITGDPAALGQVREELADVMAFLLSLANALDVDVSQALTEKMAKNELKYPAERFRGRFR